jgi:FAD/FMN-containing dehydrogenase
VQGVHKLRVRFEEKGTRDSAGNPEQFVKDSPIDLVGAIMKTYSQAPYATIYPRSTTEMLKIMKICTKYGLKIILGSHENIPYFKLKYPNQPSVVVDTTFMNTIVHLPKCRVYRG